MLQVTTTELRHMYLSAIHGQLAVDARLYLLQFLDGQYGLAISQRALESSVLLIGYQQCLIELLHALTHKVGRRYGMTGIAWYGMVWLLPLVQGCHLLARGC